MTKPNIKYLIDRYSTTIKAFACSKETVNYVWLDNCWPGNTQFPTVLKKESKVFDTWAEAHAELTRRAEEQLNQARLQLHQAQVFAGNVRRMKDPTTNDWPPNHPTARADSEGAMTTSQAHTLPQRRVK